MIGLAAAFIPSFIAMSGPCCLTRLRVDSGGFVLEFYIIAMRVRPVVEHNAEVCSRLKMPRRPIKILRRACSHCKASSH